MDGLVALLASLLLAAAQAGDLKGEEQPPLPGHLKVPPSPALKPADALKTFEIADGFRIDLFAHEPMVRDPVAVAFDEDGRLWVAEMLGFMPDIRGTDDVHPTGRVSVLEDTDHDGKADRATVFREGLVLPRAVAIVKGGVLVADTKRLLFMPDADGDLKADRTEVIDPDYTGAGRAVEHQPNGLLRGIDNWTYNAKSKYRYRRLGGRWIKEETEFRGQWGITQDDAGRLFYNYNWDQLRADLVPPSYLMRNPHHRPTSGTNVSIAASQKVHPIRMGTGVNRGYRPGILDARGYLREFASACAPLIWRGDAYVCGPGANLVKRNRLVPKGNLGLAAEDVYQDREFLASTDERFRPVALAEGLDGALYVVDMYRGILQDGKYITTHLRNEILARGLDTPIHWGRIYRIVREGVKPPEPVALSKASREDLFAMLGSPIAARRHAAQRLLVDRGESLAGTPDMLKRMRSTETPADVVLMHVLWTREGVGGDPGRLWPLLDLKQPRGVATVVRVLERLCRKPDREKFIQEVGARLPEAELGVQVQMALSLGSIDAEKSLDLLALFLTQRSEIPIARDAVLSGVGDHESELLSLLLDEASWRTLSVGKALTLEALAAAIVRAGKAEGVSSVLDRLEPMDWRGRAMLAGLATAARERRRGGPLALTRVPAVLVKAGEVEDRRIRPRLETLRSAFSWPGHEPEVAAKSKARPLTGAEELRFAQGRNVFNQACAACHGTDGGGLNPLGPPLLDSEWVLGPPERLAGILFNGLEGPITVDGTEYKPPMILPNMPSVASLENLDLAAVMTYVRRAWDHGADPVTPEDLRYYRAAAARRLTPWTEADLRGAKK